MNTISVLANARVGRIGNSAINNHIGRAGPLRISWPIGLQRFITNRQHEEQARKEHKPLPMPNTITHFFPHRSNNGIKDRCLGQQQAEEQAAALQATAPSPERIGET
jgi:hypothetical protein